MTLEERYNASTMNTYVGRVKELQGSDSTANQGVNFLDGDGRNKFSFGATPAPDEFQSEFTRNTPGSFLYGGGGKSPAATNDGSYPLSRWLDKSLKLAFDGVGPRTQPNGYWGNNRFTLLNDVRNSNTSLHNYTPVTSRDFISTLQSMSKGRVNGAPSGPSPAGISG